MPSGASTRSTGTNFRSQRSRAAVIGLNWRTTTSAARTLILQPRRGLGQRRSRGPHAVCRLIRARWVKRAGRREEVARRTGGYPHRSWSGMLFGNSMRRGGSRDSLMAPTLNTRSRFFPWRSASCVGHGVSSTLGVARASSVGESRAWAPRWWVSIRQLRRSERPKGVVVVRNSYGHVPRSYPVRMQASTRWSCAWRSSTWTLSNPPFARSPESSRQTASSSCSWHIPSSNHRVAGGSTMSAREITFGELVPTCRTMWRSTRSHPGFIFSSPTDR